MALETLSGLGLPVTRNSGGYFTPKTGRDVAFSDLVISLLTPIGSRPMRRDFGSGLSLLLFDPNDKMVVSQATRVIQEAAQRWCPWATVLAVRVEESGTRMFLRVTFSLIDDRTPTERMVTVPFDKPAAQMASALMVQ
jgi:phage baseplate assembly protein W